ncbi:MAG TPA: membrane protein insertion efficiency factor YidD [Hyphomicrobiaceae bacterium]|nr:membrane protein insertion efficiency factor YidD [Hyphomicrobiaceae bacterium]
MSSTLAVAAIHIYRCGISPFKGFRCAHDVLHRSGSCSDYGLEVFRANGLRAGISLMRQRFADCRAAFGALQVAAASTSNPEGEGGQTKKKNSDACWCDIASGAADIASCGGRSLRVGGDFGEACSSVDVCACSW